MMYPYLTLNDDTEITHSEMKEDGSVKVYIETPDNHGGFRSAVCWLPQYRWEDVYGYTDTEMAFFKELIRNNAHLMIEFSRDGGVLYASRAQKAKYNIIVELPSPPASGFEWLKPVAMQGFRALKMDEKHADIGRTPCDRYGGQGRSMTIFEKIVYRKHRG